MSNFETWWEREGQEFLFALNTTTDDDIKLVAEIAWKNGAYCAEQAEQEPVCCDKCGSKLGTTVVPCDCIAPMQQAEQKPMAIDWEPMQNFWRNNSSIDWGELESAVKCAVTTPVRTKNLTDDEIAQAVGSPLDEVYLADFRAVIAADREKNK